MAELLCPKCQAPMNTIERRGVQGRPAAAGILAPAGRPGLHVRAQPHSRRLPGRSRPPGPGKGVNTADEPA